MPSQTPTHHPTAAAAPAGEARWQVCLLGTVSAFDGVQRIDRFPSRAVAALLARLALAPERAHPREELVELLWPGVALAVGRNRLRQVLSTLKSLLEPAGIPGAEVLQADRLSLRVVRGALACDALDFERALRAGEHAKARRLYRGELMPGHYDEWIDAERQRLTALHERLPAAPTAPRREIEPPAPSASAGASMQAGALAPPASLPTYLTRLFGADQVAARLRALVLAQRLVTLLGPGGSGKTRLAVEVAHALRTTQPWPADTAGSAPRFDRIAFVSLVACDSALQMLDAIARALQLPAGDGPAASTAADAAAIALAGLRAALAGQHVLLVLDNLEQLADPAQALVGELLAQLPALHVLVTSRRALGLDGETCIHAEPLPLPADTAPLAAAGANPAVALFVDRARAVRADFHLGERNAPAIVALVRLLHGMPLAIELAASRVRSFPPAEMVALLAPAAALPRGSPQLALLSRGGPRAGHDPRHASMTQVIDWSWRLLDAPAQQLLQALTLFPAEASATAVAAVAGKPWVDTAVALDALVSHSLVRVGGGAQGEPRFGLLEPVREFAAALLPAAQAQAGRARLRGWLLTWARALGPAAMPASVARELSTVHAVLAGAAADGAPQEALALALALRGYWDTDGLPASIQRALEQALQAVAQGSGAAADALVADSHELLAYLRFEAGFAAAAREHAEAAVRAAAADPARRARALVRRAWVEIAGGRDRDESPPNQARLQAALAEALALARACGDREAQARALHQMAVLASHLQGDWNGAEALLAQSQALWLALGDRRKAYARQRNRAQCWLQLGRQADARASFESCEQAARDDGDWVGQIDSLLSLSSLHAQRRDWAAALALAQRCVVVSWQRWHRHGLAYALWNPPRLLARLRQPEAAILLMGFAATFWESGFGPLGRADRLYVRQVRALAAAQLGPARTEALWLEGAAMDVAQAVALTLRC